MKKVLLFAFMALCFSLGAAAQGVLKFATKSHNFGKFTSDKVQTFTYTFVNTGDEAIVIYRVASSCGCTIPEYSTDPVEPGESGSVTISYNGSGKQPGRFRRVITVYSNATEQKVKLSFEGNMQEAKEK